MKKDIDIRAFNEAFDAKLKKLRGAERITKQILGELSREVLEQIHFNGDIQPVNRLIDALTPVNKKATVLYFQHFSGHQFSEKDGKFGKRDKQNYAKKLEMADAFLEDEDNNIWTWAAEHIEVEAKPFDLKKVTAFVQNALKKADKEGFSHAQVMKAIFAGGMEVDAVLEVMKEMAHAIDNPEKEAA